jgi:hypothetical protein
MVTVASALPLQKNKATAQRPLRTITEVTFDLTRKNFKRRGRKARKGREEKIKISWNLCVLSGLCG